jgi:hypothetical protein
MSETQDLLTEHGLEPREEITPDNVELIFGYVVDLILLFKDCLLQISIRDSLQNGNEILQRYASVYIC